MGGVEVEAVPCGEAGREGEVIDEVSGSGREELCLDGEDKSIVAGSRMFCWELEGESGDEGDKGDGWVEVR